MKPPRTAHAAPQPGSWYFDRRAGHYVQVLFGAQMGGYVTVDDAAHSNGIGAIRVTDLDLGRTWTPSGIQRPAEDRP